VSPERTGTRPVVYRFPKLTLVSLWYAYSRDEIYRIILEDIHICTIEAVDVICAFLLF
jgi:hypothetical protein